MSDAVEHELNPILAAMTAKVAQLAAESFLPRLRPRPDMPQDLLEQLARQLWRGVAAPDLTKLAQGEGVDENAMQEGGPYYALFMSRFLELGSEHLRTIVRALDRGLSRLRLKDAASAIGEELGATLAACLGEVRRGLGSEARRTWVAKSAAQRAWHEDGEARLREALEGESAPKLKVQDGRESFERAFSAALIRDEARWPADPDGDLIARWHPIGPARPQAVGLPHPAFQQDYTLCYDPQRRAVAYVQRLGERQLGPVWHRVSGEWQLSDLGTFTLDQHTKGALSCHYDASRGGLACWIHTCAPIGKLARRGVLFGPGRPTRIAADDEPFYAGFSFTAVFAYDRDRAATVHVSSDGIYELDVEGRWLKRLDGDAQALPRDNDAALLGAAYDTVGRRVIIWCSVGHLPRRLRFLSWDGTALRPLEGAPLPPDASLARSDQAAAVLEHPLHGLLAYMPAPPGRCYRLAGDDWIALPDRPVPEAAPAPPAFQHQSPFLSELLDMPPPALPVSEHAPPRWFARVHAAHDPEDDSLLLGPGEYGEPHAPGGAVLGEHRHVMYTQRQGSWSEASYALPRPPRDVCMVCDGPGGPVAIERYGSVHRLAAQGWIELLSPGRVRIIGAATGASGDLFGVDANGAMHRLALSPALPEDIGRNETELFRPLFWEQVGAPPPAGSPAELPDELWSYEWISLAYDAGAECFVLWVQPKAAGAGQRTLLWRAGGFSLGYVEPRHRDAGSDATPVIRLVYDTALRCMLRVAPSEVAAFLGDRWVPQALDPVLAAVDPCHREVVHDAGTGQTLLLDLAARLVIRLDLGASAVLGELAWPESYLIDDRSSISHPGFPLHHTGYCAATRHLRTHSRADYWASYEVDMGPFFDEAARRGVRTLPRERGP